MSNASATATAQGYTASTDTKVGDLVTITAREGIRQADGSHAEVEIEKTFRVESVDNLNGNLWCKGTTVATTSAHPDFHIGRGACAYIGKAAA